MTDKIQPINLCPRDAWGLFWAMFKNGDEVIVITEGDKFHWGRLEALDGHCLLHHTEFGKKTDVLDWNRITFISHDGFPVRQLMGADGSAIIDKLDTRDPQRAIREALGYSWCSRCGQWERQGDVHKKMKRIVFSDPWEIENVKAELVNPGMLWSPDDWRQEETVMLYAKDGARGLLWNTDAVYYSEISDD